MTVQMSHLALSIVSTETDGKLPFASLFQAFDYLGSSTRRSPPKRLEQAVHLRETVHA